MPEHFADRLMRAIKEKDSRVCVGIDPVYERLPVRLKGRARYDERDVARAVEDFCTPILEAVRDDAAAVKFNSAFFEVLGPFGGELLQRLIATSLRLGLITIVDAKRSDIGSTAGWYARAVFANYVPVAMRHADAVTINPWLGSDGTLPFINEAKRIGGGVFVLVKTSNPSSAELQDLVADGKPIYRRVADLVSRWGAEHVGESGYSSVGAVVGATHPEQLSELRRAMPHAPLLVPGFGAQGGGPEDVAGAFDDEGLGAIVNSSRGIIFAWEQEKYRDRFGAEGFDRAAAAAAAEMRNAINSAIDAPEADRGG